MTQLSRILVSFWIILLAPLQADPSKEFSRKKLLSIIEESTLEGELPSQLIPFKVAKKTISVDQHIEKKGSNPLVRKTTYQTKISNHEFIVLEIRDENGKKIQSDVIAFDYDTRMFNRWQIFADKDRQIRFLVGDPTLYLKPADRRKLNRSAFFNTHTIIWRTLPDWKGPPTIINDVWVHIPSEFSGYRSVTTEYDGTNFIRREFIEYRSYDTEPKSKKEDFSLFGQNYGDKYNLPLTTSPSKKNSTHYSQSNGWNNLNNSYQDKSPDPLALSTLANLKSLNLEQEEEPSKKPAFLQNLLKRGLKFGEKPSKQHTFKDLNFQFSFDQPGWIQQNGKRINPSITLFLVTDPPSNALIIAGNNGNPAGSNSSQLVELAVNRIRQRSHITKSSKLHSLKIDELDWKAQVNLITTKGIETTHSIAALSYNDFIYTIIYTQEGNHFTPDIARLQKMISGFKLLDKKRKAEGALPMEKAYSAPMAGVFFDPRPVGARYWLDADLKTSFPFASYGALTTLRSGLVIVPLDLGDIPTPDSTLATALFPQLGLDYPTHSGVPKKITQGSATGQEYHCKSKTPLGMTHYQVRILQNQGVALAICSFAIDPTESQTKNMPALLDAVKITPPRPENERVKKSTRLTQEAILLNEIGMGFFSSRKFAKAAPYFKKAHLQAPEDVAVISNLIISLRNSRQVKEAFEIFNEKRENFADSLDFLANEPYLHVELGDNESASKVFAQIFSKGHRNEDDLLTFINLLAEMSRYEQAKDVVNKYLENTSDLSPRPYRWQHQVYGMCGLFQEALKLARALADKNPANEQFQSDLTLAMIEAGESAEALTRLDAQLNATPNDPYLLYQKGRAFSSAKQYQKAKESFELALKQSPGEPLITEALAAVALFLGQGDQTSIQTEISAVTLPSSLLEKFQSQKFDDDREQFNSRTTLSATAYFFKKDEPFKATQYRNVEIRNQGGVEEYKTIRFDFDTSYERAFINQIEVLDADGRVIHSGDQVESYVSDSSAQSGAMATTTSTVSATVPGLKPGCKLRYAYTIETLSPVKKFPFKLRYFASLGETAAQATIITGDYDQVSSHLHGPEIEVISEKGHRSWFIQKSANYYQEPLLPSPANYLPYLALGNETLSWETLANDYLVELNDRLSPSKEISKLANALTKESPSPQAKADAILKHVRDNLVYQAIEFGQRARIPLQAKMISENRYGDCKDHSLLAHLLLKSVGIKSHLTLVHTSAPIIDSLPSLDQFDHMILFIPKLRGGTFFDGTGKFSAVTQTSPLNLAGKMALVLDGSSNQLSEIIQDPTFPHSIKSKRSVKLDPHNEQLNVEESITFKGSQAANLRGYFKSLNEAEWKQNLEQLLGHQIGLNIKGLKISSLNNFEAPLILEMKYQVSNTFKNRNGRHESPIPAPWEEFYFAASQSGQRRSPFQIITPMTFESEITVEGNNLKDSPWNAVKNKAHVCQHTLTSTSPKKAKSLVKLTPGTYPASDYKTYVSSLRKTIEDIKGNAVFDQPPRPKSPE